MQAQRGTISQSRGTNIMTACGTVKWSACVCDTDTVSRPGCLHTIDTGKCMRMRYIKYRGSKGGHDDHFTLQTLPSGEES